MASYKYYIAGKNTFTLFIETNYEDKVLIAGATSNPIWGHKKKTSRCILRSFYGSNVIGLMKKETFLNLYTIIKSGLISKDLLTEKIPQLKQYERFL